MKIKMQKYYPEKNDLFNHQHTNIQIYLDFILYVKLNTQIKRQLSEIFMNFNLDIVR